MSRLDEQTFVSRLSEPVLWHTDLHMGNIYVSEENPSQMVSLIDWQSIVVSPLFIQVRFPELLPIEEDYVLGPKDVPKLPPDYEDMDADDKEYAKYKYRQAILAKMYELNNVSKNFKGYKALHVPSFLRELFIRSGQVSEEGIIPLRACLIELSKMWTELGYSDPCPVIFSEQDLHRHEQQLEEYDNYCRVQKLAMEIIGTDFEGWITPQVDLEIKQQLNKDLLEEAVRRSNEFKMSSEKIRRIWPYQERSHAND
jgi:hypothetical protein